MLRVPELARRRVLRAPLEAVSPAVLAALRAVDAARPVELDPERRRGELPELPDEARRRAVVVAELVRLRAVPAADCVAREAAPAPLPAVAAALPLLRREICSTCCASFSTRRVRLSTCFCTGRIKPLTVSSAALCAVRRHSAGTAFWAALTTLIPAPIACPSRFCDEDDDERDEREDVERLVVFRFPI